MLIYFVATKLFRPQFITDGALLAGTIRTLAQGSIGIFPSRRPGAGSALPRRQGVSSGGMTDTRPPSLSPFPRGAQPRLGAAPACFLQGGSDLFFYRLQARPWKVPRIVEIGPGIAPLREPGDDEGPGNRRRHGPCGGDARIFGVLVIIVGAGEDSDVRMAFGQYCLIIARAAWGMFPESNAQAAG